MCGGTKDVLLERKREIQHLESVLRHTKFLVRHYRDCCWEWFGSLTIGSDYSRVSLERRLLETFREYWIVVKELGKFDQKKHDLFYKLNESFVKALEDLDDYYFSYLTPMCTLQGELKELTEKIKNDEDYDLSWFLDELEDFTEMLKLEGK